MPKRLGTADLEDSKLDSCLNYTQIGYFGVRKKQINYSLIRSVNFVPVNGEKEILIWNFSAITYSAVAVKRLFLSLHYSEGGIKWSPEINQIPKSSKQHLEIYYVGYITKCTLINNINDRNYNMKNKNNLNSELLWRVLSVPL